MTLLSFDEGKELIPIMVRDGCTFPELFQALGVPRDEWEEAMLEILALFERESRLGDVAR